MTIGFSKLCDMPVREPPAPELRSPTYPEQAERGAKRLLRLSSISLLGEAKAAPLFWRSSLFPSVGDLQAERVQ